MESKIYFLGDFSRVNDEERAFINRGLERFIKKHEQNFSEMYLKIDSHLHKETSRGRASHYLKVTLTTDKGRFHSENQDFGAEKALMSALKKLDTQIIKHKR